MQWCDDIEQGVIVEEAIESQFKQQTMQELSDIITDSTLGKRYSTRQYTKGATHQQEQPLDNVSINVD